MKKEVSRTIVRITPIALTILKMVAVGGLIVTVVTLPGMANLIAPFLKKNSYSKRQAIQKNITSLVRNGFVRERKNRRGETVLEITKRGKWESMIRQDHEEQRKKMWDGVWHVVIFDIPSTRERKVRGELHRAMKLYGFRMVQKSVWVYPYDCEQFLLVLKDYLGVSNDILYMRVEYIENATNLKKEFGIA